MNTLHHANRAHGVKTSRYPFKSLCLSIALLGGAVAPALADSAKLVGSWKVHVQQVDCVSGQAVADPFVTLTMYYADGNALEQPYSNPASRTASYGSWVKAGKHTYAAYSQFGVLDANGFNVGYMTIERMNTLAKDGQTFETRAKNTFYGLNDEPLFSGCAVATGGRLPAPTPF